MAKSKGNASAQFTYDFGIAIAQSTVNKLTRLTGATLTLASAFYALKTSATEYVDTLRENTLRFGGVLSTMKAMEQAQNRLIKGQSYFNVDDQLKGMNQLMSAGIDAGKNFEWVNKAAHATGKSFAEFSGMIASAVQGNSGALVEAGLMTQRATRMFDRYAANTVMRQQAILNFVKNHKGLMNAIKGDFETVQDQMRRIKGTWTAFLQEVLGKPNDPQSFYGQITASMKMVAVALERNWEAIRRYAFVIGQVLGWVMKQIGHFVVWTGRQTKQTITSVWKVTDDFQNQARSLVVWLEFWKLKVVDFFKEYGDEIMTVLKLVLAYKALKYTFIIGEAAILSVLRYRKALLGMLALQRNYLVMMGPAVGNKFTRWLQSLAAFMPRWLRRIWVSVGKFFERGIFGGGFMKTLLRWGKTFLRLIRGIPSVLAAIWRYGKIILGLFTTTNPVGWIVLAISLIVVLYTKWTAFRKYVNRNVKTSWELLKVLYNLIVGAIVYLLVGIKRVWQFLVEYLFKPIAGFFVAVWQWIKDMWKAFMNTSVGRFINNYIVSPLKTVFEWVVSAWNWVLKAIAQAVTFLAGANSEMAKNINELAKAEGLGAFAIAAEGGSYNLDDDTNYLNPSNWFNSQTKPEDPTPLPTGNPMLSSVGSDFGGGGGGSTTNMNFGNGAIQIIVNKGEGIDEQLLAQKVRSVVNDLRREGDMRGGTI